MKLTLNGPILRNGDDIRIPVVCGPSGLIWDLSWKPTHKTELVGTDWSEGSRWFWPDGRLVDKATRDWAVQQMNRVMIANLLARSDWEAV